MDCFPEDGGECEAADCNETRPYGGGHIHAKQVLGWRREWRGSLCEHFCHGHYNLKNGKSICLLGDAIDAQVLFKRNNGIEKKCRGRKRSEEITARA
jgi:hypothetical protein